MDSKTETRSQTAPLFRKKAHTLIWATVAVLVITWTVFPTLPTLCLSIHTSKLVKIEESANIITKNAAVIVDDRPLINVIPLLLHFSSTLGPDWSVVLFTTRGFIPWSAPFRRAIDDRRLTVRFLPTNTSLSIQHDYSNLLTSPWFWEQLEPAEHVLLFQADSILCANSPVQIQDFLQYDFVGAPIDGSIGHGQGFSGGLSLRNRTMMLDIVKSSSWSSEYDAAVDKQEPSVEFEDQWFYKKMKELPELASGDPGARLPSVEVAKTFAVATTWYESPLGYHQIERWHGDRLKEVDKWCPERRLASRDLLLTQGRFRV